MVPARYHGTSTTAEREEGSMNEQEHDREDEDDVDEQEPVRVETREEFDDAVTELFNGGPPIEAPSVEVLEEWGVDLEDEGGGIEDR